MVGEGGECGGGGECESGDEGKVWNSNMLLNFKHFTRYPALETNTLTPLVDWLATATYTVSDNSCGGRLGTRLTVTPSPSHAHTITHPHPHPHPPSQLHV